MPAVQQLPAQFRFRTWFPLGPGKALAWLIGLCLLLNVASACAATDWPNAASLNLARSGHTATLLANGKVLIAGGVADKYSYNYFAAALYDPTTNTWTAAGALETPRSGHTATLLPNGKVLIAGGITGNSPYTYLSSSEVYDPATNAWTAAGALTTQRNSHTATLLPNGKVLVAGGTTPLAGASAELYDPTTYTWSAAGPLETARRAHTATLLHNGKVLIAGGATAGNAETYDPITNVWTAAGTVLTPRFWPYCHAATQWQSAGSGWSRCRRADSCQRRTI